MEIYGKVAVVLFTTFFDANTAREFLQNRTNFKETEQNNFVARWFKLDDEQIISENLRKLVRKYTNRFIEQNMKKSSFMGNSPIQGQFSSPNYGQGGNNGYYPNWNTNVQNNEYSQLGYSNKNNNNNSYNKYNSNNQSYEEREKKGNYQSNNQNVKFNCRFEIQIDNDKEFQVARRLIGSKVIKIK